MKLCSSKCIIDIFYEEFGWCEAVGHPYAFLDDFATI
jgi:hypothetical protein